MRGNDLKLIELAFTYVSAETEPQAKQQVYDQAAALVTDKATLKLWLDLIDYMQQWNRNDAHKGSMSRASALQFFSTQRVASGD